MEKIELAPIVLFAYARPEHTLRTLAALAANTLAAQSHLYIYVDGLKPDASEYVRKRHDAVCRIVHEKQWCGQVYITEHCQNKGLAASIRDGVTEILEKHGKIIVVEDDLVTSPAFLTYMNKALDFYQTYPSVFSISGYNYPATKMAIPADYPYDTYVCLRNSSWGWATWKDRWHHIDWDIKVYERVKNDNNLKKALNRMGDDEFKLLQMRQEQHLNIWSIQFTMAHFVNHAVAIYPTVSYVDNIGNDGSGENCTATHALDNHVLSNNTNPNFVDVLYEDSRIVNAFYNVNCRTRRPLWQKLCNFVVRKLGQQPPYTIKRKIYAD